MTRLLQLRGYALGDANPSPWRRDEPEPRYCPCGCKLSRYNPDDQCAVCQANRPRLFPDPDACTKTCRWCGGAFWHPRRVCCSPECVRAMKQANGRAAGRRNRERAAENRMERRCEECGGALSLWIRADAIYCSRQCRERQKARRAYYRNAS